MEGKRKYTYKVDRTKVKEMIDAMLNDKNPKSLRDIAKQLGVSVETISRIYKTNYDKQSRQRKKGRNVM